MYIPSIKFSVWTIIPHSTTTLTHSENFSLGAWNSGPLAFVSITVWVIFLWQNFQDYSSSPSVWKSVIVCYDRYPFTLQHLRQRNVTKRWSVITGPLKGDMQPFFPNWLKVVSSCLLQYKPVYVTKFDKLCRKMLKGTSLLVFLV